MSQRGLETRLPAPVREWLEAELIRRGFADYAEVTAQLNAKLEALGAEEPASKSAVHRYGQVVEERIAALKRAKEIARVLAAEVGDDEGAMNDALLRLTQEKLFNLLLAFKDEEGTESEPKKVDLAKIARAVAELGKASVQQKKHQAEMRERMEAKFKALEAEARGGKSGLDPETLRRVREAIHGVT